MQRNLVNCPKEIKEKCYRALVRPIMEYAAVVWDPATMKNVKKVEMVQSRAARTVVGDYRRTSSVTKIKEKLVLGNRHLYGG